MCPTPRPLLLALALATLALPATACLPPPLAMADGEVVAGDPEATTRALLGGDDAGPLQTVPLRHVVGSVDEAARLEAFRDDRPAGDGQVPVTRTTLVDGDVRWGFVLAGGTLASAQAAPTYQLLDALTVQTDPGGAPSIARAFFLEPDRPALLIANAHFNSQEGFAQHSLLALVGGAMETVWEGPVLYSLSTSDDACDLRRVEQVLAGFDAAPTDGGWPTIAVRVVETERCEKDGRLEPSQPREYATTLRFDLARSVYVGALPDLEAVNRARRGD